MQQEGGLDKGNAGEWDKGPKAAGGRNQRRPAAGAGDK